MSWFGVVRDNVSKLPDALDYFEAEYIEARTELKVRGSVDKQSADLPGIVEQRFAQLQELEAILEHFNILLRQTRSKVYRKYLETYNKSLSSTDVNRYVEGEDDVVQYNNLVNEVALMRNKWIGITKGLDQKAWQLGNLTRLKCAGMDDFKI